MKKSINLWVTTSEKITLEVEFPIYVKHDSMPDDGEHVEYHRTDACMRRLTVVVDEKWSTDEDKRKPEYKIMATTEAKFTGDLEFDLGRKRYACGEEEFNKAFSEAKMACGL